METVERTDTRPFGEPRELAVGLAIPATLARAGVQVYRIDGRTVREYRPPEEVFSPESLASFRAAPVTLGHPPEFVTAKTWQHLAAGSVLNLSEQPHREDSVDWVSGELSVQREDAINDVKAKRRKGLSVGYRVDIDPTPGVTPEGEPYDQIQRNIRANHVALLLESESPRAGKGARLRTDNEVPVKVKLNGIEYDRGSDAHLSALEAEVAKNEQRADQLETERDEARTNLAKAEAERDAAKERADKAESERNDATSEAAIEKAATELAAFRDGMRKVLGKDYDFAGKSRHQTRLDALAKLGAKPSAEDETTVAVYLQARLDALPAGYDYNRPAPVTPGAKPDDRNDADDDSPDAILARKRAEAYNHQANGGK